jgi:tRNA dimethylallyltransferase
MATGDLENEPPLVVIVGPTASGKTSLAIELAKKYDGEIICADSRTIYKGMDIGTAKPTADERAVVPHWGLDLVEPGEPFSAAAFKSYALRKIEEIRERHRIPFLVGGSGLYVDAIVFDFQFSSPSNSVRRQELEALSLQELQKYCIENNITLPENSKNKRYIIRAIERQGGSPKRRAEPISKSIIVGIATDREILRQRIRDRAEQIFDDNVVEEATLLGEKYGWDNEAMTGNIYPLIRQYVSKEMTFDQMKEKFATADWRLAKRQLTWLRRNRYIQWFSLKEAKAYLSQRLAKN